MLKQESLRTYIIGGTMLRRSHQNINSRLTKTTVMSLFGLFIFYNDNAGCAYQFFFRILVYQLRFIYVKFGLENKVLQNK